MEKKYLIIGAGNVGTSLYRLLTDYHPGRVHLYGRKEPVRFQSKYMVREDYNNFINPALMESIEIIFFTVPDDHIKEASRIIHMYPLAGKKVFHTSGARDSSELQYLAQRGAHVGSLHPMQSFAKKFSPPHMWKNIVCSFEGDDVCFETAKSICEKIEARLMRVTVEQKVAIHIAGVFAANFSIALLNIAEKVLTQAGVNAFPKNEILYPLLNGVVENYQKAPSDEILTGPIKRGDISVLRKHINYMQKNKINTTLYLELAYLLLDNPNFSIKNSTRIKELLSKIR